jgi:ubiquinone/menaquinone biosynthesis C-methylase UbiE
MNMYRPAIDHERRKWQNPEAILADIGLKPGFIFFGIALHDFQDPARVLENARRMVKSAGKLVNLDWKKEPMDLGPPLKIRFSEDMAVRLIQTAGFTVETVKDSGPYHYLVVAKP